MDDKFNKIENKLDHLDERLDDLNITLAQNTAILDEHQRRSQALEKHVDGLETRLAKELLPIKEHVSLVKYGMKAVMWFCVAIGGLTTFLYTILQLLR